MHELFRRASLAGTLLVIAHGCARSNGGDDSAPRATPGAPGADAGGGTGERPSTSSPDPSDDDAGIPEGPSVRFIGRFDARTPDAPRCGWPGCRIIANFEGSSVTVTLTEHIDDWMIGGPSEWDVAIDGVWKPKLVLTLGKQTLTLADKLGPGSHRVELYKRSEAQTGVTEFDGFSFGAEGRLLSPPPRRSRSIEVVGDSMLTGFGMEGVGPVCPVSDQAARWANFHRSFGALLGEVFDADVYGTAYSGKGITQNIWRPDPWTMPKIFPLANPLDPSTPFDFTAYAPNVVVVGIGGLDFAIGQPDGDGPANLGDFTLGYTAFMKDLRARYPNAQVVCIVGPGPDDGEPNPIRDSAIAGVSAAVNAQKAAGDARITLFLPGLASAAEITGCNGHGNPTFHERVAREIAPIIQALTGW